MNVISTRRNILKWAGAAGLVPLGIQMLESSQVEAQAVQQDPLMAEFHKQHIAVYKEYQDNNWSLTKNIAGRLAITTRTLGNYGKSKNIDGQIQAAWQKVVRDRGKNALLAGGATDAALIQEGKDFGLDVTYEVRTETPPDQTKRDGIVDDLISGKVKITDGLNKTADLLDKVRPKLVGDNVQPRLQKAFFQCDPATDPCWPLIYAETAAYELVLFCLQMNPLVCLVVFDAWLAARTAVTVCHIENC